MSKKISMRKMNELLADAIDVSVNTDHVRVSPVDFVWNYVTAHRADMTRIEMIHALRRMGLNKNMVSTQMSRYFTADGDRAAWYRLEKSRKAA